MDRHVSLSLSFLSSLYLFLLYHFISLTISPSRSLHIAQWECQSKWKRRPNNLLHICYRPTNPHHPESPFNTHKTMVEMRETCLRKKKTKNEKYPNNSDDESINLNGERKSKRIRIRCCLFTYFVTSIYWLAPANWMSCRC